MIFLNDHIRYERVLSKKYEFYYMQLGDKLTEFLSEVKSMHAHPNGPVFYSLNNVPKDKKMKVEFFIPVKEIVDTKDEMKFHSLYSVEQMISMRITNDFEHKTEEAYSALLQFIQSQNLIQLTPPYHIIDTVDNAFVTIKIGYIRKDRMLL